METVGTFAYAFAFSLVGPLGNKLNILVARCAKVLPLPPFVCLVLAAPHSFFVIIRRRAYPEGVPDSLPQLRSDLFLNAQGSKWPFTDVLCHPVFYIDRNM